jgi:hypothetical protein
MFRAGIWIEAEKYVDILALNHDRALGTADQAARDTAQ